LTNSIEKEKLSYSVATPFVCIQIPLSFPAKAGHSADTPFIKGVIVV